MNENYIHNIFIELRCINKNIVDIESELFRNITNLKLNNDFAKALDLE